MLSNEIIKDYLKDLNVEVLGVLKTSIINVNVSIKNQEDYIRICKKLHNWENNYSWLDYMVTYKFHIEIAELEKDIRSFYLNMLVNG